ncbi:MAG: preprotein translocase subunit SecG [Candidatus Andersenbacteria bacterium]|nr:preprotein translocase subunit SecG [Candidatus Andersenbacteria bacterium]MBI3251249.1 preprotein translocase subunit SecG [Candidatus Andersenbacteria bacterium]
MLWLNIAFIIVSVALMAAVLIQSRSAGLGTAFGGGAEGFHIRRGSEKRIFQASIILSTLFLVLAAAHIFWG